MESIIRGYGGTSTQRARFHYWQARAFIIRESAVPKVTSSAKFTCFCQKSSNLGSCRIDGRKNRKNRLQCCIFSCSTSYISNMVTVPSTENSHYSINIVQSSSQYPDRRRRCSGNLCSQNINGFPQLHWGKACSLSSPPPVLPVSGHSVHSLLPTHRSTSPRTGPAWVMMAKFFSFQFR